MHAPPVLLITAGYDPLREKDEFYAGKLRTATHAEFDASKTLSCWHQYLDECPPDKAEIHAVSMVCRTTVGSHSGTAEALSVAMASSSLRRWPTEVTPMLIRSSAVSLAAPRCRYHCRGTPIHSAQVPNPATRPLRPCGDPRPEIGNAASAMITLYLDKSRTLSV